MDSDQAWLTFTRNRLGLYEGVENTGNPHTLRDAYSSLEQEAQKALGFLAAVRCRQNALRPFSRIPVEILGHIFTLIAADEYEYLENYAEYEPEDIESIDLRSRNLGWVKGMYKVGAWYIDLTQCVFP